MFRSATIFLLGLAVIYAQAEDKPNTVIVKKFYGNAGLAAPPRFGGFAQQPYPYATGAAYYQGQNYYSQGQYRAPVYPSPVPVFASPAPVYASPAPIPVSKAPVYASGPKSGVADRDARILSEERNVDFDGTFKYAYQTDNGIAVNAEGFVKQPTADSEGPIQVIQGSYTLYTPEGVPVQISYIADENGYRASGDAIPTPYPELAQAYANAPVEKQK